METFFTFITEIPENGERRIHLNYEKTDFIDCGLISEKIKANDSKMPTTYGFLKDIINTVEDEKEHQEYIDAFFGEQNIKLQTGDSVEVKVIGMFEREDGDHKVIVVNKDSVINEFSDIDTSLKQILLDFHGFNKKITKVFSAQECINFLCTGTVQV